MNQFESFVSKFEYNVNVSGYSLSIPSRFIDSFMVGTAVITDKLHCRWYKDFDSSEVLETVEMGYLPLNRVDWEKFTDSLRSLPQADAVRITNLYKEKWAPNVVAQYIIDTVKGE